MEKSKAQLELEAEIRAAEAKLSELRRLQRMTTTQEAAQMIAKQAYEIMEREADRQQIPFSVVLATMNKMVFESDRLYEGNGVDY